MTDESKTMLEIRDVTKTFVRNRTVFGRPNETVKAVRNISLSVKQGETLGIVGESGSGKSTLGRLIVRLDDVDSGEIVFEGEDLATLSKSKLRARRRDLQMIFQDPYASLDPTKSVGTSISEPLRIYDKSLSAAECDRRVRELLPRVGLRPEFADRYPGEMSGGQRQRVAIARALAIEPRLIVADEAVSALDMSTQSEVINLLAGLTRDFGLTSVFISHNLSIVRHISDRIAVMYLGQVVELGPADTVYAAPQHPYPEALLSAIPIPDPVVQRERAKVLLPGDTPDPAHPPKGCAFASRCPYAQQICLDEDPELKDRLGDGTLSACHFAKSRPMVELEATLEGAL
ncbi:MAG TPA: ATP-binding cassette domain-containing protein [Microbacteriaceae bacterium]|nr:ATP-binding cassette domain-containing protein [Microbacteriaceae bacterium]